MGQAGQIPGLCARWLTRDVDRPDAGYSISLWKDEASMRDKRLFENVVLPKLTPFFSGEYTTSRCEMRFLGKFRKAQPNAIAE
jgi:hypothetical protein